MSFFSISTNDEQVTSGPKFHLQLKAEVVIPDLGSSHESLDFGSVKCGECKIATIQLKNEQKIRCEWLAAYPGVKIFIRSNENMFS